MRDEIRTPPVDPDVLLTAITLARKIYAMHEAGVAYDEVLAELAQITNQSLTISDSYAAFGSVSEETWVRGLLLMNCPCPSDLTDSELLALLEAICSSEGEEWQTDWWMRCVEASTGCSHISDLVYCPMEVLGKADERIELTPAEILIEAKRWRERVIVLPPAGDNPD